MSTRNISITLDEKTLDTIENSRGLVPRSTFIESLLKKSLPEVKEKIHD